MIPAPLCFGYAVRLLAFYMLAVCARPAVVAEDSEAVLQSWLAGQTNLHHWSATVVQTRFLKTMVQPLVATGQVWVAFPDQFRWQLGEPPQTIALRRPEALYVMYPRLQRAEKYPLQSADGPWRDLVGLLEAGFPRHRADLERSFKVQVLAATNGVVPVRLEPRQAAARRMIPQITALLALHGFTLVGTEMLLGDGSRMRNDYSQVRTNEVPSEAIFLPPVPPAYRVVEAKH